MKKVLIYVVLSIFFTSLFGCKTFYQDSKKKTPSRHDKIYVFQHRILPKWVHHSDGQFFSELEAGIPVKMFDAAKNLIDEVFAKDMVIKSFPDKSAYIVKFQQPVDVPACYYVLIQKNQNDYSYYTLEKSYDPFQKGHKSVLGAWGKDGRHRNMGAKVYDDLNSFVKEILK